VAEELGVIDFQVTASLPGPVTSLTADLSSLPPSNSAAFTTSSDNASGAFHWSPELGSAGIYGLRFVTISGGLSDTTLTGLYIRASGTSALTVGEFIWDELVGYLGWYSIGFSASDQGGTSGLTVNVEIWGGGCPDTPTLGSGADREIPQQERVGSKRDVAASTPAMSWAGDPWGAWSCVPYSCECFSTPVDLVVEAFSTTPESDLALSYDFFAGSFHVNYLMRDPRVVAPETAYGDITTPLAIQVHAIDPDGDAISTLTADLSDLPPGNDAVFTESSDHLHGTLTWTPAIADSGDYTVDFRAANLFAATKTTSIHIRGFDVTGVPVSAGGSSPRFSALVEPNPVGVGSKLLLVTTRSGPVQVRIFDVHGRLMRELPTVSSVGPGKHEVPLRMDDGLGHRLRSGVYFYRVEAAEGALVGRLAVLK
jgi:PKD repeat protein